MTPIAQLHDLRAHTGPRDTLGLPDEVIERFLADPQLGPALAQAISEAHTAQLALRADKAALLALPERELVNALQADYVNFYDEATVNPYVALAARGPWLVTTHGGVLHDSGGYGMLGFGHAPEAVITAMARPHVMANVMTASFSQAALTERLKREIGHTRGGCPFAKFICLNSGSEATTVAARISDINARNLTQPGARHDGHRIKFLALRGAFHGRTDRPAQLSHSSLPKYEAHLASFRQRNNLILVEPNSVGGLHQAFDEAERDGVFIEAMFMEPVMGEGNPGQAITRAFYDAARERTARMGSVLVVDSIQAGLRGHGVLSIVDYPGFQDAVAPDVETYSKALNGGQFPLSVLAVNERAAGLYVRGVYGNTMTTNPRALEVAVAVLDAITPELRANIRERGEELVRKLQALADELPGAITKVQGTGLLVSAELDPARFQVVGFGGVEEWMRLHGFGVIHGGKNALRYTPWFGLGSAEVDLMVDGTRQALKALGG